MPLDKLPTHLPSNFHPAVSAWFEQAFDAPTPVQTAAWPEIIAQERVLIAAPTGSGKTLAAFLCAINELVLQSRHGALEDKVHVLYISPLKALSNDIEKNLQAPLLGITDELAACRDDPGTSAGKSYYGAGHVGQVADFVAAIRDGRDPFVTAAEVRHTVAIVLGTYES